MAWNPGSGLTIVGNNDPKVSPYLKAWIRQGSVCVCGVIGEGTSKEIQVNWNSPFEEDSIGGKFQKVGGLVQAFTDVTSKGKLASQQVWEGNRPHVFNLTLRFYALSDARAEVMLPLMELEKMLSPEVYEMRPGGRIPQTVSINVGRTALYNECVIQGMTVPLDGPRTKDGYLVKAETTLQVETLTMLNQSEIARTYG
ncbi:MAG: hypothetical protein ABIL58_23305 [Pseudomonadota bacterium]